ncbi:hypothetical protein J3E68DRAFT_272955 [Trichoderma sp. SZMC 28012]
MQGFNSFLAALKQMPATSYHHGSLHGHAEAALTTRQILSGPPSAARQCVFSNNANKHPRHAVTASPNRPEKAWSRPQGRVLSCLVSASYAQVGGFRYAFLRWVPMPLFQLGPQASRIGHRAPFCLFHVELD